MQDRSPPPVTGPDPPSDSIESAIASLVGSEQRLRADLSGRHEVDPASPSRLPSWTIGHVMTHLARNADSILSMFAGRPQYPHGREGRNADIEAGAKRSWAELVADVGATSEAVVAAVSERTDWTGTITTIAGDRPAEQIPLIRQREVEVHRVDLGLGHEFDAVPADYLRRDLQMMELLWVSRRPKGTDRLPDAVSGVDPPARLSWLMGRTDIDGVDPAGLF